MKTILDITTNYRYWVLTLLAGLSLFCLLGEPTATSLAAWMATFVLSKTIGATVAYIAIRLFRHWERHGEINCLTKFIGE